MKDLNAVQLVTLFDNLFESSEQTRLIQGGHEPIYLPAACIPPEPSQPEYPRFEVDEQYHRLVFCHDYFSSALHEIAHWCIAGESRRQQIDFAYWYHPDGRSDKVQERFEAVEVKPQALEWIFSVAAGHHFRVSLDNLNGLSGAETGATESATDRFTRLIFAQVQSYQQAGLPARAAQFRTALCRYYGTSTQFTLEPFKP